MDWNSKPSLQHIDMSRIVPTQETVLIEHLEAWAQRISHGQFTSPEKPHNVPIAMQFNDSDLVYLTDGHHRWYIAKLLGLSALPCYIDSVDQPLDACVDWWHGHDLSFDNESILADLLFDLTQALEDELC